MLRWTGRIILGCALVAIAYVWLVVLWAYSL